MKHISFVVCALVFWSAAAYAQDGSVVRLSATQIQAAEAEGAKSHAASAMLDDQAVLPKRQIHGEVSMSISSRGGRAVYGSMVAPLGNDGTLAISLADVDYGRRR